jgi:hypothetical protein
LNQDIFFDADGLIVHQRPDGTFDGGDTAKREGWYWLGVWIRQNTPGFTTLDSKAQAYFRSGSQTSNRVLENVLAPFLSILR